MFLYLVIYLLTNSYSVPPKYDKAVTTAREATYKQSGAEADFLNAQSSLQDKGDKFVKKHGLETPAAVLGAVVPVLIYKKIRVKEKNLVLEANKNSIQATLAFPF